jgi:class 3 adenylate cyclase
MEWQDPEIRRWYERLARTSTVVRYDGRGNGLSQRGIGDVSLDAHVRDLEAVVSALAADSVSLLGVFHSGPPAIAFAARHPKRSAFLVLWCTYGQGSEYWRAAQAEGLRALRQSDYRLFLRTAAHELFGWSEDELADRFANIMEAAVDPDEADRLIADTRAFDVRQDLARVGCPTLVVHRRALRWLDVGLSRDLAAQAVDGRLVVVEGSSPYPAAGPYEEAARAIEAFLGRAPTETLTSVAGSFRTILFTDLVGHTEMMARLGDNRGRDVLREHERITREALLGHGGFEVKTLGDGFMASFSSVSAAIASAIDLQRRIRQWNAAAEPDRPVLAVRIGLNAGEPIQEGDDFFGSAVIIAARIAARAVGASIHVSNAVRELAAGKGFVFSDAGSFIPKGLNDELRVWEVAWEE